MTPLELQITLRAGATEEYAHGLYQVTFHELGHAMGFWLHSSDTNHCMNSSNQQDAPHPDEIRLAKIVYHMDIYEDLGFLLHE
jgi:predicted Zn-dependent protease